MARRVIYSGKSKSERQFYAVEIRNEPDGVHRGWVLKKPSDESSELFNFGALGGGFEDNYVLELLCKERDKTRR